MSPDAIYRAALAHRTRLSADIELQLRGAVGAQPIVVLLERLQANAASAIVQLAEVNAEDVKAVRTLQNDIRCFDIVIDAMRELVRDGIESASILDMEDRTDLAEVLGLSDDEAEQVMASGLPPTRED